jgi:Sec-independent protein translocase protein TatA
MFGFSLAELIVVLILALIFIKPKDLPEIAYFLGKMIFRIKKFFNDSKSYLKSVEGEIGLDQLKHELNRGIAEEKSKIEDEMTVIVDMYGNEHQVPNVKSLRADLSEEEINSEISRANEDNIKNLNSDQK